MKRVLLVTKGIKHPTFAGRKVLIRTLCRVEGIEFEHSRSLERLPGNLSEYDAVVLYFHEKQISSTALSSFEKFVSGGGGVLAIHSATASFMEEAVYFDILGGRFIEHGPISTFQVAPISGLDAFTRIPPFHVEDELYLHETKPGIIPHFMTKIHDDEIPVVWTNVYGKGRVCYASPGHCTETMRHPEYQNILMQGLNWVISA